MKSYSNRTLIRSTLLLSLTIFFIISGFGIKGAIIALLLSELGTFLFLILVSKNFIKVKPKDYFKTSKKMLKFGSQILIANAIYLINT